MKRHSNKSEELKQIARTRVSELFKQANEVFDNFNKRKKALANRYVELARKISMKFKLRMPSILKRSFCKECHAYLRPGKNCSVRLQNNKITYHCKECNSYMRFPYIREKKQKKQK